MTEGLKLNVPTLGWEQMLTGRKEMLDKYDVAKKQAKVHEVEVSHGPAAEAAVREWLTAFLPQRYGVTSGYIVSPGVDSESKLPHYDVIIFDRLESPILWVEKHSDLSEQGRVLAIPVEHVQAVLEVKSAMSSVTVRKAIEHLHDLAPLMSGFDPPGSAYKLHLPEQFTCAAVFFELRTTEDHSEAALEAFVEGIDLRGYLGGLVLRAESHTSANTGRVNLILSETPIEKSTVSQTPLSEFGISKSTQGGERQHVAAQINWMEADFARFGFDLIARMQGTYQPGILSSFYGMGSSYTELMKLAQTQGRGVFKKDIT